MEGHRDKPSSGTPPEVSIPPLPKHTPEPWVVQANADRGAGSPFAFAIIHPVPGSVAYENICLVWNSEEHGQANTALLRLSPRMARFVKYYFDALEHAGLTMAKLGDPLTPDFSMLREAQEIIAELKKAGVL